MTTIGLAAIVKNEAGVITRALDSVRSLVDYILIEDTGSSDGTQQIIFNWLDTNNVPGTVIEEPWQSFAYNRSHVLAEIRKHPSIDFVLMLDADEVVTITNGAKIDNVERLNDCTAIKQQLTADCYSVEMNLGSTVYSLPRVTRNRMPFYYRGPVHEFVDCRDKFTSGPILTGISIREVGGGAREKDPNTYKHDAELFKEALSRCDLDPLERSRYTFYLAQSLRDSHDFEGSIKAYLQRVELGGWPEELYVSLFNVARLQHHLKRPFSEVVATFKRAIQVNPRRAEALHGLIMTYRLNDLCHEGYALGREHIALPMPKGLFIESWVYDYALLDEFSICAYYSGHYSESWIAAQLLLTKNIDATTRTRVATNANFAAAKCI